MELKETAKRSAATLYKVTMSNPKISAVNRKYIEQHVTHLRAVSLDDRSIIRHLYGLNKLLESLGYIKDLKKVNRKMIEKAVAAVNAEGYSSETRLHFFGVWKSFYRWLSGDGVQYPLFIAWLKLSDKNRKKLMPEDILSEEDIKKMIASIEGVTALRDKVFIILLYETGCRISEILGIRRKDVNLESDPIKVNVTGKTGWRRIPVILSASWLSAYFNIYKFEPDDVIWKNMSVNGDRSVSMSYEAARNILRDTAKKAGIKKPVNPHSFRKARATHLANKLSDQQLKSFFGWVPHSDVMSRYIGLNGADLDNAYLRANGREAKEESKESLLKMKVCPKCKFDNSLDMQYCGRCGSALDIGTAIREEERKASLSKYATKAGADPDTPKRVKGRLRKEMKVGSDAK
jgi:site-specific recombinase XerD/ribosomal protein L40E